MRTLWQAFYRVTVPLSAPGVVTTGLADLHLCLERVPLRQHVPARAEGQPATVIIPQFASIYTTDYGAQAAAALLMTMPLVIMVLFFQRRIVSGLTGRDNGLTDQHR